MRKLGIDEWIVMLKKVLYEVANSRVRINSCFLENFDVTVGVHQDCFKPATFSYCDGRFLFHEYHAGYPWEFLYADDLVIISDNLEDLKIQS